MVLNLARIAFSLMWFALGLVFLTKQTWIAPELFAGRPDYQITMLGLAAVGLGVFNLVRLRGLGELFAGRNRRKTAFRERLEARRRPVDAEIGEYNPELDFTKPTPPSADQRPSP